MGKSHRSSSGGYPRLLENVENGSDVLRRGPPKWALTDFVVDVHVVWKRVRVVVRGVVEPHDVIVPLPVVGVLRLREPNVEKAPVSQEEPEIPGRISGIPFDTRAFDQFGER